MNQNSGKYRWALLVGVILSTTLTANAAQTFGYTTRKPQLWETQGPALEQEPGTNLYWHDPLLGSWETCRAWAPASNGCPPSVYGRADMLALYRNPKEKFPFATIGPLGPTALSTSDYRSEFNTGVRGLVGMTLGSWYRLEVSYFGSYTWSDTAVVRNLDANDQGGFGNLYSPFSDFGAAGGVLGLDYFDFASLRFQSRLNNGEANIRRRVLMRPGCYETSFLMGGRYMEISEQLDFVGQSTVPGPGVGSNVVDIDTSNKLLGFQIGMLSQFLLQPRCWIDFEMKGGIFQNRADLNRTYTATSGAGAVATTSGTHERDRTSFVGDLSLQFNYQFAPSWTFYAGYNAIWVTGLALGPENFETDPNVLVLGPTLVDHRGEMVYHGPNVGVVFSR